ncbi:hypothetical protein [Ornithinimicrobium pratense]|uniref:Glycosyltransferase RgtA/B/C/D-like domain-containing protein n=1 Tax=Ornithinimicrobium pratense TaxID=2593973 RepID=A0A5J6V9K1_9MICO|nr:hypothetical protein [Ornithinimicrobium pratense]QFG70024.1 hypothetical protein FY030_16080 [Ornithinimicrobium pratense]
MSGRGPRAAKDSLGPATHGGLAVLLATLALSVFALWRARLGSDLGDGTHVVALAMRMAQGDQPLTDEMNLQALGSVPAVPFTWLWLHFVGIEAVVLASRVFYVALALAVGTVGYRALRTRLPRTAAFTAVVLMLLPTPYNLLVTSYNTLPVLMLGLAGCAGFAALSTRSARWAACAGVALAVTVLGHPASLPAAAMLGLTVLILARRGPVVTGVLVGGGAASALMVLVLALGPGLGAVLETVRYTTDYQASRPGPFTRLAGSTQRYLTGVLAWRHLPALVLALLALLPRLPWRWRATAALGIPVVLAGTAWVVAPEEPHGGEPFGLYSATFALLLLTFLAAPVLAWAHRVGDRDLRLLLVLTAPTAVLGVVFFAMTTSASIRWGAPLPPVLPLVGAVGVGLVLWAGRHGTRTLALLAALALVGSLLAVHPLRSFRDGPPGTLLGPVTAGPMAGLHASEFHVQRDEALRALVEAWVEPGDGVFFYSIPGAYTYSAAPMQTNLIWISAFGQANEETVRWWRETGRLPDVAVVAKAPERAAGSWDALVATDPLLRFLQEHYELVADLPRDGGDAYVFRAAGRPTLTGAGGSTDGR